MSLSARTELSTFVNEQPESLSTFIAKRKAHHGFFAASTDADRTRINKSVVSDILAACCSKSTLKEQLAAARFKVISCQDMLFHAVDRYSDHEAVVKLLRHARDTNTNETWENIGGPDMLAEQGKQMQMWGRILRDGPAEFKNYLWEMRELEERYKEETSKGSSV